MNMSRRQFLSASATIAGAAMLPGCAHNKANIYASEVAQMQDLKNYAPHVCGSWITKGEEKNAYDLFKKTVEAATDFSWLSSGDRVLLKLALNKYNPYPTTTDPWAVSCMVKLLKEKGAGTICAGDQSGVQTVLWTQTEKKGSSRECCDKTGLLKAILESEAAPCFFEEKGYDAYIPTLPQSSHHWQHPICVTSMVNEVDHIVYLPRVSSHVLGDATLGFKVAVGFLREDSRMAFHQGGENFYAMYEEINQVPEIKNKFRLVVSSGRSVLSTFGPDDGHVCTPDHGLLIASADLFAHEILSYAWLQWNREFNTPFYAHATTGGITQWRSLINRGFVWSTWSPENKTPVLPMFKAGNIYSHPAVINCMKRMGGRPGNFQWEQINSCPDKSMVDYLEEKVTQV
jgi:uncharacterized protein (DUF362 family)